MARTPLKRQVCYNGPDGKFGFLKMSNANSLNPRRHFSRCLGGPPVNWGNMWQEYQRLKVLKRVARSLFRAFYDCHDCGRPWRDDPGPMLHDMTWATIAHKAVLLCHRCTLRRLGRPICMHDLVVCDFNLTNWEHFG